MRFFTLITSMIGFTAFGQTSVLNEDFSNGIPSNYILINDNHVPNQIVSEYTQAWITIDNFDDEHGSVASSTSYFEPVNQADRWMIVPNLQLGAFGNILSWDMKSQDPTFPEKIKVLISTTGTNPEDFRDTLYLNSFVTTDWTQIQLNLANLGYVNQEIHVAFILNTINGFRFYMDNLKLETESDLSTKLLTQKNFVIPNPFQNTLKVLTDETITQMTLINTTGQIIKQTNETNIQTESLQSGVYIINIETQNGSFQTRVIKH